MTDSHAHVFYGCADDASAAVETLRAFGLRAVCIASTVAEVCHGTERVEWEVIALDLPARRLHAPAVVERRLAPSPEIDEQDRLSSYWWDEDGHGRDFDRD